MSDASDPMVLVARCPHGFIVSISMIDKHAGRTISGWLRSGATFETVPKSQAVREWTERFANSDWRCAQCRAQRDAKRKGKVKR